MGTPKPRARRAPRGTAEDPVYTTIEQVVARIGFIGDRDTAQEWADWPRDPLRLRYRCGIPWTQESVLGPWLVRTFGTAEERAVLPKIRGKEAICKAFGRDWRTVRRYARLDHDPLPLESGSEPWVYRAALIDWVTAHDVSRAVYLSGWDWKGPPATAPAEGDAAA